MKDEKHIVSLSGGKDSTAMLLRLLEENYPVDLILYCDTGLEFPEMYDHLRRLEEYIHRPIVRLYPPHRFEYFFMSIHQSGRTPHCQNTGALAGLGQNPDGVPDD